MSRTLPMFPLGSVLVPTALLPLHVFEQRYRAMVADVLGGDNEFGVVLIDRGHEVGGGDVRSDIGTIARVVEAQAFDFDRPEAFGYAALDEHMRPNLAAPLLLGASASLAWLNFGRKGRAFIEALIAGELEAERFPRLVADDRRQRFQQRMRDSNARSGISRYEQQQRIEREFRQETGL